MKGFVQALGNYTELIRKFMLEDKIKEIKAINKKYYEKFIIQN